MLNSHDAKGSIPMDMSSLGVVDLDISPHAFGLRAFDHEKPLTCLLLQLGVRVTFRRRI